MDQSDIDALLAGSGFSATTVVEENPPDTAEVDPDDIDALLAGSASEPAADMGDGGLDIDALLEGTGIEASSAPDAGTTADMGDDSADDDMDSLLGDMGFGDMIDDAPAAPAPKLDSMVSTPAPAAAADLDSMLDDAAPEAAPEPEAGEALTTMETKLLMEMPLTLTFEVGRARMAITDLLSLGQGSVLELHRLVGEDLDLFVNGQLIARGEVVVVNEKFGARIIEIISPRDRVKRMGGLR